MKTNQQRNEYIGNKMQQLDKITDAHKHTRRLARIVTYCSLLTTLEVNYIREELKRAFK